MTRAVTAHPMHPLRPMADNEKREPDLPELGIGLDEEGTSGTGQNDTGTGLAFDFEERRVTDERVTDARPETDPAPPTRSRRSPDRRPG